MSWLETATAIVDPFDMPAGMTERQQEEYRRRFGVLLMEADEPLIRDSFVMRKAQTAERRAVGVVGLAPVGIGSDSEKAREAAWAIASRRVRAEHVALSRLSVFKHVPTSFGTGEISGEPVLIEEWLEGASFAALPALIARPNTETGAGAVDVAVLGTKLYQILDTLGTYGAGQAFRGVSADSVIVLGERADLAGKVDVREFEVRMAVATADGGDPADVLLDLLGPRAAEAGAALDAQGDEGNPQTRDERIALAAIISLGKRRGFDAAEMSAALARWVRLHDEQQLLGDGTAPYSVALDYRVFVPFSRQDERVCTGVFGKMHMQALDASEQNPAYFDQVFDEFVDVEPTMGDKIRGWALSHLKGTLIAAMLAYTAVVFAVGWALPLDLPV